MTARADLVIVGAGLAGAAAAQAASARGLRVVVLEAFGPGHKNGSSHGSARIFRRAYEDPLYVRLTGQAGELWRKLGDQAGERLVTFTGGLDFGAIRNPERLHEVLTESGVPAELLSADAAAERWPYFDFTDVGQVMFHADAGVLDPDRAIAAMLRLAAADGADVRFNTPVTRLEIAPGGDGAIAHTDSGMFGAPVIVVAVGAWIAPLLDGLVELPPLTVTQQQVFHFAPTPEFAQAPEPASRPTSEPTPESAPGLTAGLVPEPAVAWGPESALGSVAWPVPEPVVGPTAGAVPGPAVASGPESALRSVAWPVLEPAVGPTAGAVPESAVASGSEPALGPTAESWPIFISQDETGRFCYGLPGGRDGGVPGAIKVGEHNPGPVTTAVDRDFRVDPAARERVIEFVAKRLPGLDTAPVNEVTCLYTWTANEDFILDRPGNGPFVVASPCSGHGAKFAPLLGEIIADLATGSPAPDPRFTVTAHLTAR